MFAPAECDLHHFMRDEVERVLSVAEMLDGLRGLCSALCHVHNYFLRPENVQKLGSHRDIHPGNILVKGHALILSDFGLSKLKALNQGSRSGFAGGVLDYYAPECQDWEGRSKEGSIGRRSDIWSLGCVMAEILTFMVDGSERLKVFDERRMYGGFGTFHAKGAEHEEVTKWLEDLTQRAPAQLQGLSSLIKKMLSIEQESRPHAWNVLNQVSYLFHQTQYNVALGIFEKLKPSRGYNFEIEFERFKIWSEHAGLARGDQNGLQLSDVYLRRDYHVLDDSTDQLKSIIVILRSAVEPNDHIGDDTTNTILHTQLRVHIDKLWQFQESTSQTIMARKLETIILSRDSEATQDVGEIDTFSRPQLLLVIRQALRSIDDPQKLPKDSLLVDQSSFTQCMEWEECLLGRFTTTDGDQRPSITELYHYDDTWIDRTHELVTRVQNLVVLLSQDYIIDNFPVLRALAFYHIPARQAYGLVFAIPKSIDMRNDNQVPRTLANVIKKTSYRTERPSLDDVYALAYKIADTVLSLHKAQWLHKGISAYKIIVFPENEGLTPGCLLSARILGFQYSRGTEDSFTTGPPKATKTARYRHP